MWGVNLLVGSVTTLAIVLLFWPLRDKRSAAWGRGGWRRLPVSDRSCLSSRLSRIFFANQRLGPLIQF
jgi:hypothetical protein